MKNLLMNKLLIIAFLLASFILLVIGFAIGYLYVDKSCNDNPLIYGIRELNKLNDDDLTCVCISNKGKSKPFYFNEKEIKLESFFVKK